MTNNPITKLENRESRSLTKREFFDEWVRAVNAHGGFGKWAWAVSKNPADLPDFLNKAIM